MLNKNKKGNLIRAHTLLTLVDLFVTLILYLIIIGITCAIKEISDACSINVLTTPFLRINVFSIDFQICFRFFLNIWFFSSLIVTLIKHTIVSVKDMKSLNEAHEEK